MAINLLALIKKAMLTRNTFDLGVLRLLKTEIVNFENAANATKLTDADETKIIIKMIKQRKDSVEKYNEANRNDLAIKEQDEIDFLSKFLPKEASKEDISSYVIEVVSKGGGNMGSYIKEVKLKFPTSDGKFVSDEVKKIMTKKV